MSETTLALRSVVRCDGGGSAMVDTLSCGHTQPAPTRTQPWDDPVWRVCRRCHREALGRVVRQTWVRWASEQPDAKPAWLVPWDELDAGQREVDMRIGEAIGQAVLRGVGVTGGEGEGQ